MKQVMKPLALGVDLGGTKLKVEVIDAKGKVLCSHNHPTNFDNGSKGVISAIVTCIKDCLTTGTDLKSVPRAMALGIGVAAQVDAADGAVRFAPNLGWKDGPPQG